MYIQYIKLNKKGNTSDKSMVKSESKDTKATKNTCDKMEIYQ